MRLLLLAGALASLLALAACDEPPPGCHDEPDGYTIISMPIVVGKTITIVPETMPKYKRVCDATPGASK